jgi:D-alanyl-D-alanine carboxypeptidase
MTAGAMLVVAPAAAGDYKPVRCSAAKAYAGPALEPPPTREALPSAAPAAGSFDTATTARLEAALATALAATKARAITVAVSRPGGAKWSAVRNTDGSSAPQLFWWASAGKMLTAATILQLAEEGRLSLQDPIARYVPGVPNGEAITLEHLLAHTSGLFSANEDRRVREGRVRLTLADELAVLRRHGAMFCPGERWRYSNSGYGLLGAVVEKVDGRPFAEAATTRVLNKMGAGSLRVLKPDDEAADVAPLAPAGPNAALVQPSRAGPAAPLVGLAEDMNRLLEATLTPGLSSVQTRDLRLARLYRMFDAGSFYGLGIMVYRPPGTDAYWIGHGGGSPGANAISIWSPADNAFVSVALTGDGSAAATANLLLAALRGA